MNAKPSTPFEDVEHLSPELRRAARWLEQNPGAAAMHSMRECARRAGIAPPSFSRLARALGYCGFAALKQHFQRSLLAAEGYAERAQALQARARRGTDWRAALSQAQEANTLSPDALNPAEQLADAARAMLGARCVHVLGQRASYGLAFHLYYLYRMLAANGRLVQDLGGTLADQIARLGEGDVLVAISFQPYTGVTVAAAERARAQGACVIAVTDSAVSPLATGAQHTLLFHTSSPSYFQSMVGGMALVEQLVATVAVVGGRRVLANVEQAQRQLMDEGAYWSAPRRRRGGPDAGAARKRRAPEERRP